jgi:hypothetical protein
MESGENAKPAMSIAVPDPPEIMVVVGGGSAVTLTPGEVVVEPTGGDVVLVAPVVAQAPRTRIMTVAETLKFMDVSAFLRCRVRSNRG